jgi:hypothetical protein
MATAWNAILHSPSSIFAAKLVEPEVVATSPNRIKSPVPVCCGFDSKNECARGQAAITNGF